MLFVHILSTIMLLIGSFFFLVGTIGLIRMPDVYSKMHATTKCDTLGAGFIMAGLMLLTGFSGVTIKLLLIIVFIWLTNPTAAHIIAKANYRKK